MDYSVYSKIVEFTFQDGINSKEIEYIQKLPCDINKLEVDIDGSGMCISSADETALSEYINSVIVCLKKRKVIYDSYVTTKTRVKGELFNSRNKISELFAGADDLYTLYIIKFSVVHDDLPFLVTLDSSQEEELLVTSTTVYLDNFNVTDYVGKTFALVHKILENS